MDFVTQRRAARVQGALPALRHRGDPPGRAQARRRGEPALGGHEGGPRVGPARDREHPAPRHRPRRPALVIYAEEMHWGCAGIALAISGSTPRRRRHRRLRHPGADPPAGFPSASASATRSSSAPTRSPSRRPAPTSRACARPRSSTATSGSSTGPRSSSPTAASPTSTSSSPPSTPSSATAARPRSWSPRARPGLRQGKKESKIGIRASHTAEVILEDCRDPGREPARRHGQARAQARARPLGRVLRPGLQRARHLRADAADGRRLGARDRPGRLRVDARPTSTTARSTDPIGDRARRELDRRPAAARAPARPAACSPTSRPRSRRRGCWSSAPRGWAATASR